MGKNQVSVESIGRTTRILINDVLHIAFKNSDLKGVQSWKMGKKSKRFCTELYFVSDGAKWIMELEYDDQELSKNVLDILKEYI